MGKVAWYPTNWNSLSMQETSAILKRRVLRRKGTKRRMAAESTNETTVATSPAVATSQPIADALYVYPTCSELCERRRCVPKWVDVHACPQSYDPSYVASLPRAEHDKYSQTSGSAAVYRVRVMDEEMQKTLQCTCPKSQQADEQTGRAEVLCTCPLVESAALEWTKMDVRQRDVALTIGDTIAESLGDREDEEWGGQWTLL